MVTLTLPEAPPCAPHPLHGSARAAWTHDAAPLFLVGCPRSGTTWVQALLASHPAVYSGPETHFFQAAASLYHDFTRVKDRRLGLAAYLGEDGFRDMVADMFWRVVSSLPEPERTPEYFLEKSPQHCLYGDFILSVFPHARFLHLIRDGRAVAASLLRVSRSWGRSWAPGTVTEAAGMWMEQVQAGRSLMARVPSPEQYVEVRYEDLRADPQRLLGRLFRWLRLPADPASIARAVEQCSLGRTRGAASPFASVVMPRAGAEEREAYPIDFVGQAPASGDRAELSSAQRRLFEAVAGPLLEELGYPV